MSCRRKFLNAARLLELRGAEIEYLREWGYKSVDPWPLMNMYGVVCDRYTDPFYSPQAKLFANPAEAQDEKWGRYFYHVLMPHLLLTDCRSTVSVVSWWSTTMTVSVGTEG